MASICKRTGCDEQAIGTVLTQREYFEKARNVEDGCRPHHVEDRRLAGALVACELVRNGVTVVDVDGSDKEGRGTRVELDADEVNIDMLVDHGFLKRLDAPSLAESLAADEEALTQRLADTKVRRAEAEKAAKAEKAEADKVAKAESVKA